MAIQTEPARMLTVKDVARLLNVHENTVRRWSDSAILKSFRITKRGDRRFDREEISNFLAGYDEFNTNKSRYQQLVQVVNNREPQMTPRPEGLGQFRQP
jgi:excisionase family DNA binding protein